MILGRMMKISALRVILSVFFLVTLRAFPATAQDSTVRRVIVSWHEGPENIYVVNPDGSLGRRLTNAPEGRGAWVPNFAPDCMEIVFASNMEDGGAASIYVMNPDGSNVRRLTDSEGSDYSPSYSPGGARIFFLRTIDGRRNVWLMNRDGSDQRQLIDGVNESLFYDGALSPDSSRVLVSATPPGAPPLRVQPTVQAAGADLYGINIRDGSAYRLTTAEDSAEANLGGIWSGDGTRIAFGSNRDGNWEVFTMGADGRHQRQLTHTEGANTVNLPVAWSPDGRMLAIVSSRDNGGKNPWIFVDAYLVDVNEGIERRLTRTLERGGFARAMGWDEDGIRGMWSADGALEDIRTFRLEGETFHFVETEEPAGHGSACGGG